MTNTDMSLRDAAQAVIDRWETPLWKDAPATAAFIADLRDALARDAGRASLAAAEAIPKALPTGWSLADHGDEISLEGPSGERWRYRAASGTGTDSDFIYRFLHASLSANAREPTCDMRTVVAVAVTMLYDTHPEDVCRVFDRNDLETIVSITEPLGHGRVEDIYRDAWDHVAAPPTAQAEGWMDIETAPKDGQAILVTDGMDCYCVEWSEEFDWWTVDDNKLGPFRLRGSAPAHWMKLPPAPGPADQF